MIYSLIMAGLDPTIHEPRHGHRWYRGCPAQGQAWRKCRTESAECIRAL